MKDVFMDWKKWIPFVVVLGLVGCFSFLSFLLSSHSGTNVVTSSSEKVFLDSIGVDWSNASFYEVSLKSGNLTIRDEGVYHLTGTLKSGSITIDSVDNNVKLVLDDASLTSKNGPAINVVDANNVYIELVGDSFISSKTSSELDGAIYSKSDLILFGDGSLTITSNKDGIKCKDDLEFFSGTYVIESKTDGIKGKDSVTIHDGVYTITSVEDGIKTTNESEKGDLVIEKGTFKITSKQDGIQSQASLTLKDGAYTIVTSEKNSEESQKGLKAETNLLIENGVYNLATVDDAIHSNDSVEITGGEINLSSDDDGVHADNSVLISGGTIKIVKSYEGIEGYAISFEGGNIQIFASDDGVNIGGGNDGSGMGGFDQNNGGLLSISGGEIYVNSDGDGLDSNGSIQMSGGIVHVDGPTNNGNGALDYNGEFVITGGELIAVGFSGMAQNVSTNSTQNTILITLSSQATGEISLGDIHYSPKKSYQSIVISSSSLQLGQDYLLQTGTVSQNVRLTDTVTGGGMGMNPGGGMRPGGGFRR